MDPALTADISNYVSYVSQPHHRSCCNWDVHPECCKPGAAVRACLPRHSQHSPQYEVSCLTMNRHMYRRFPADRLPTPLNLWLVFANKAGGRFLEIRGAFKNACERAGISDLHFHDLRHTFASQWMMAGGDLYVLKSILGHKSIVMTQRYAHLSPEFKRAAVDRMDNIWKVGAKPQIGAPA